MFRHRLANLFISALIAASALFPVATAHAATQNLIANPSVETVSASDSSAPGGWYSDSWGTNTTNFGYKTTGHSGGRSVYVNTTSYTDGDAKWFFDPIAVTPNTQYTFSDYYQSSIWTDVLVQFRSTTGNYTYKWITGGDASASWKQLSKTFTTPANVQSLTVLHLIEGVGYLQTDDFSLSLYQATAPTVSVVSPAASSTVSGTTNLLATASDDVAVAGVQFKVDGNAVGAEYTTAPYQMSWDSSSVANGSHSLVAVARNTSGLTTVSDPVTFTVQNTGSTDGQNIVPNASVETVGTSTTPLDWASQKSKNNNAIFNYLKTGHSGSRSVQVKISSYTTGDAFWAHNPQLVNGGKTYEFSDWYKATAATNVYGDIVMQDGSEQWINIGLTAVQSPGWNHFYTQFTMPVGARTAVIYHSLAAVGTLTTDDYQLNVFTPTGFTRGLVTLTFDDGIRSTYTYGLPELDKFGFKSTQYFVSGLTSDPYYMTAAMMKAFATDGHEIGSHTVTHPHLIDLSATQMNTELKKSQTDLLSFTGAKPTNFATPYGEINSAVLKKVKTYYGSQRGVETGYNAKNNFDRYDIKVQDVVATTTVADITNWVNTALSQHTWLVLVYHATDPDSVNIPDANWDTPPAQLDAQFQAIKDSGITVKTLNQALNEVTPQL